jgi:spoIIIJ-associated protein
MFVVKKAKTVEEATRMALQKLGALKDEVRVEVMEGGGGILGQLGVKKAEVKVSFLEGIEGLLAIATQIFKRMGFSVQSQIREDEEGYYLNVESAGKDGLLIGRGGRTIKALQYLINRIYERRSGREKKVFLDIDGYQMRRERALSQRAFSMARQAKLTFSEVVTEPLPPADRRIIHKALERDQEVRTFTVGKEDSKRVVISPQP